MRANHRHTATAATARLSPQSRRAGLLALLLASALAGPAGAQVTNQITALDPSAAAQGESGLLVTFTLDTDSPPAPPAGIMPTSVTIGTLAGTSVTHASQYAVTAVFTIPMSEPVGARDCSVVFPTPQGTVTFSLAAGFAVTAAADTPPSITQQPVSRTVRLGAPVTFTVGASGTPPLAYQWQKNQTDIDGATAASFGIGAVAPADAAAYRCVVSNDFGTATSDEALLTVDTNPPTAATSYLVVDTGQVTCYDDAAAIPCPAAGAAFAGQDAQHLGYQPSFTASADGLTVVDHATGLTWQHTPDTDGDGDVDAADKMTWSEAQGRPAELNAVSWGGFSDWRLPTIKELYSLIDFRGTDPSGLAGDDTSGLVPFIDTTYFEFAWGDTSAGERIIDSQYASSTLYAADGNKLFGVNFADGRIKGYDLTMPGGATKTFLVQCVRGNPSYGYNLLVANGDGTVTDLATDLMWAQDDSGLGMTWEEALAWVAARNAEGHLGHDDWRLPNSKELESLLDYSRSPDTTGSAAVDPIFVVSSLTGESCETDFPWYWSSTTHAAYSGSGAAGAYVCFGRSPGYMDGAWVDVHGAGAQRSDPKSGSLSAYSFADCGYYNGIAPQGDAIRISNHVRLVRGGDGPLAAGFAVSPATPTDVTPATFTATASGALSPYAFVWDLDGTPASGQVATHTFAAGTHTVTLTVTDAAGFVATSIGEVNVTATGAIFADGFESGSTGAWSSTGG